MNRFKYLTRLLWVGLLKETILDLPNFSTKSQQTLQRFLFFTHLIRYFKAQNKRTFTTFLKLVDGDDEQKLWISWEKSPGDATYKFIIWGCIYKFSGPTVHGYMRTTRKQLYLRDEEGKSFIHTPLCIMDFYIVESSQQKSHGQKLFDYVLEVFKSPNS